MSSSATESAVLAEAPNKLLIGGRWRASASGATFDVEDPATGASIASVANANADDALEALAIASEAQEAWAQHPPRERGEILRRAYELLVSRADELALLMTLEMGKPVSESRGEILYAAEFFRWFSEEAVRIHGRYMVNSTGRGRILTMKAPVGPCVFVTPWNFPTAMGARKIAPAVAAGCTMLVKPAQQTPLSMLALGKLLREAGLPAGVLSILPTTEAGAVVQPLLKDARVRKLSFTGSTAVGRRLIEQSANQVLRVSMELGGNAPFVVFEDADLNAAVQGAIVAKMRNVGEACTAANRFLIAERIAEEFTQRLTERLAAQKVGRGTDQGVEVGPLIDSAAREKVQELVSDAVASGAAVLTGGEPLDGAGWFYAPTVLTGVPASARIASEEIFGPVAPVTTFSGEDEAVALANATEYGLVSYVWSNDLTRALRVCESLQTGMVGLNQGLISNPAAPFGGVKQSGFGREGGFEGIDEYLETKYVAIGM